MKLNGIEVSGIDTVVFFNKAVWKKEDICHGDAYWERGDWKGAGEPPQREHDEMCEVIRQMAKRKDVRVWISLNSVNITRKSRR